MLLWIPNGLWRLTGRRDVFHGLIVRREVRISPRDWDESVWLTARAVFAPVIDEVVHVDRQGFASAFRDDLEKFVKIAAPQSHTAVQVEAANEIHGSFGI